MTERDGRAGGRSEEFARVDASAAPSWYVRHLDQISARPAARAYKARSLELLGDVRGGRVVDVGGGGGDDVRALSDLVGERGLAIGLDVSWTMVDEGRRRAADAGRGAAFCLGDGVALPLRDASVDAARVDRVLQHLAEPGAAIAEMARVLRPGGRLVACEPDWGTGFVDAPDQATTRAVLAALSDGVRQGWIGRQLRRLMLEAGLVDVAVESLVATFDTLAAADPGGRVREAAAAAARAGAASRADVEAWLAGLEAAEARGHYFSGSALFLASGRRP